ncbi:protein Dok-7 [Pungitius pungitius]|uniref:protein Dok-7 n=1 Tax=Pungitius pungitius TaxID=134920 RepID=UPI002E0F28CE
MTDTVVAEGQVKLRDGKKWKTRCVVLQKPSPVADCLSLQAYKEKKKGKERGRGREERLNVTLEGICGVEPGPGLDGVSHTLSILCLAHTLVLGFNSRDALLAWDARIRYRLGEVHRFSVNVEPGTKLDSGPASLHLCNDLLVLTRGVPPVVIGHWKLSALRRYGAVPNGFVFEGGTRCGVWAGVFFLSCPEGEQISFLFDCVVRGITSSRPPHGLRPGLPGNADAASAEKRISQEASELEKRLSKLSQSSLASSTASMYSFRSSVAGDNQSSISSSSSSHSDASCGSRLSSWGEPFAQPLLSNVTGSSSSTLKARTSSDDRLHAAVMGSVGTRPFSAHLHPRGLHDSGRQSSLDSGIGIAAGSQSSYSGSFSSCTGSLDMAGLGGEGEFTSVNSLPVLKPPAVPPPIPSPFQSTLTPELSSANSSCPWVSRPGSRASERHSGDYQIPSLLNLQYDTPRSLLKALSLGEPSLSEAPAEAGRYSRSSMSRGDRWNSRAQTLRTRAQHLAMMEPSHFCGSERAPSVDSEGRVTPRVPGGFLSEETQCSHGSDNYVTPEQWRSARNRGLTQFANSPSGPSPSADTQGIVRCAHEAPSSVALDIRLCKGSLVNYVNIPISALQVRESSSTQSRPPVISRPEESAIKYAHLDITAMETAERVGAEHVQGREDRLTQLESHQTDCNIKLQNSFLC